MIMIESLDVFYFSSKKKIQKQKVPTLLILYLCLKMIKVLGSCAKTEI